MSKELFLHIANFLLLIAAQVFVFGNINLFGFITPYVYVLFLLIFPLYVYQTWFLLIAFFTGLSMDFFEDSGGIHAAACVALAYIRPVVLKFSFGMSYEHYTLKISQTPWGERLSYMTILVFIHHFILFSLEIFNFKHTLLILKSTLFSSIVTTLLCVILMVLFTKRSK